MKMKPSWLVGIATIFLVGCGDSTGLELQDLVGTWQAQSYTYSDQAGGTLSVNLILTQGASYTLTVTEAGSASTLFDDGVGGTSSNSGNLSSDGQTLTIAGDVFVATRDGNDLTLVDATSEYDFDGDGSDDPATLTIVLRRN